MFNSVTKFTQLTKLLGEQDNDYAEDLFGFEDTKDVVHTDDEGIVKVTMPELIENVKHNYNTEPKQSAIIYGPPGIGKSMVVKSVAVSIAKAEGKQFIDLSKDIRADDDTRVNLIRSHPEQYFTFIDLRTAEMEPTDAQGIPDISKKATEGAKYLKFDIPLWSYVSTIPGSSGVIFFDELNQGNQQVLKALFKTFNNDERLVGQNRLGDGWCVFGAGNLGDAFGNDPLPVALTDRADKWSLTPDPKSWIEWAKNNGVFSAIIGFVASNPSQNFYEHPESGKSKGYATPRSMVNLSTIIKSLVKREKENTARGIKNPVNIYKQVEQYAMSKCGPVWGHKFMQYIRTTRSLDIKQIADKGLGKGDKVLDEMFAILQFVAEQADKEFSEEIPADLPQNKKDAINKLREDFAKDYIKIFDHFQKDYQIQLFSKLVDEYKSTYLRLYNIIFTKAKSDPVFAKHTALFDKGTEFRDISEVSKAIKK